MVTNWQWSWLLLHISTRTRIKCAYSNGWNTLLAARKTLSAFYFELSWFLGQQSRPVYIDISDGNVGRISELQPTGMFRGAESDLIKVETIQKLFSLTKFLARKWVYHWKLPLIFALQWQTNDCSQTIRCWNISAAIWKKKDSGHLTNKEVEIWIENECC